MFQIAGEIPHDSRYYTVYIWTFYIGFTIHAGPFWPFVSHINTNICTSPLAKKNTDVSISIYRGTAACKPK